MPTLNQLIRHGREEKQHTDRTRALDQCPHRQGICSCVSTRTPKKPNLALCKIAKVRLSNRHDIFAHVPGEGHNFQEHSTVLIRGGRVKDLPGVKFNCIRGVKDLLGIPNRRRGRSKYGAENPSRYEWKMSLWNLSRTRKCLRPEMKDVHTAVRKERSARRTLGKALVHKLGSLSTEALTFGIAQDLHNSLNAIQSLDNLNISTTERLSISTSKFLRLRF
ncbi:hypothetical protein M9H77_18264 [Catharanthus roseus]|uniref:Uncharacterized protein n=1 Tax=Catharanthus roseus TaxID=4058 RepID=A0ACC0B708_CATRO|nr:hypothetical protein M9H77_18264 [Catharanthus roseus]